jgi:hypothetical protein
VTIGEDELLAEALVEQSAKLEALNRQLQEAPKLLLERQRIVSLIQNMRRVLGEPPFVDTFDYECFERKSWRGRRRKIKPLLVGRSEPHEASEPTEAKP